MEKENLTKDDCELCAKQKEGDIKNILEEDDNTVTYMHEEPKAKGHVVVESKHHKGNFTEVSEEEMMKTLSAVKRAAKKVKEFFKTDKVAVYTNENDHGHIHFDIIPVSGGGTTVEFLSNSKGYDVNEIFNDFHDYYR